MDRSDFLSTVWRLLHTVLHEAAPRLAEIGLDTREFLLLSKVERHPYPAMLASELFLPPSTITMLTKGLEKRHLLERQTEQSDLRRYRFELTARGRDLVARGQGLLRQSTDERLRVLSAAEIRSLNGLLRRLESVPEPD